MKMHYLITTIVLILVAGFAVANEKAKPVYVSSGDYHTETAGPELSKIVDLCAKDKQAKFEKEWSKYVIQHDLKGTELKETITWVSDEAATQRKNNKQMAGDESDSEDWKKERQKLMHDLALRAKLM